MNFNIRQKKAIYADEKKILCLSSPSSGKTRVLTERIKHLIVDKKVNPSDIVAITFTTLAAEEMKRRLGDIAAECFIGTIHSYANKMCILNGINTMTYIEEQEFDTIIEQALTIPLVRYPYIQHLLVDECQDLSPLEHQFVEYLPCNNKFFVGDDRQEIYQFRGSSGQYLYNMYRDESYTKYYLIQNYRNPPNILDFADRLLDDVTQLSPTAQPVKTQVGTLERCPLSDALIDLNDSQEWNAWAILARTNFELEQIQEMLDEMEIPNVSFRKGDLDLVQLDSVLNENRVKILTIHACMSENTLVPTSQGLMTIRDIVEKKDSKLLVYNGDYYDTVKDFITNGKERTYTLKTHNGRSIRLTANHDVIVINENGLQKIKVKDLAGNENVLVRAGINLCHPPVIGLIQVQAEDTNCTCPKTLTKELAELLGFLITNKTHPENYIYYNHQNKDCVEHFIELVKLCFNKTLEIEYSARTVTWLAKCSSNLISSFLKENFEELQNNVIPSKILQSDPEIQCAFLRGLFENGSITFGRELNSILLTLPNETIKIQLQSLLSTLGIEASFGDWGVGYGCWIDTDGIPAYKDKVGFISNLKNKYLKKFNGVQNKNFPVCREILLAHTNELYDCAQQSFWDNLIKNDTLFENEFLDYYNSLTLEQTHNPYIALIKNIFENYTVDKLACIIPHEEEETYCLTMSHESQFIQNGFLMGNSKGLEFNNVIVVGARIYNEEERKIAYVAATRAKDALYWCPSLGKKKKTDGDSVTGAGNMFKKVGKDVIEF